MGARKPRSDSPDIRDRIVAVVAAYQAQHNRPPTYSELVALVGMRSKGHLSYHIIILVAEGRLVKAGGSRGLQLPPPGWA